VNYYLLTTAAELPGMVLLCILLRLGLIAASIGTAGTAGSGDVRADHPDEETGKPVQSGT
jgi:PAT family beta-lactamase induction signal transducer AmpG